MDEDERQKKLQAGREKLAKFQKQRATAASGTSPDKKKRRKKSPRKSTENGKERCIERPASSLSQDSELYEGSTTSELSGIHSILTSQDSDQRSTSADEYSAEETNGLTAELRRIELRDAKSKITQLEETLYGKQTALQQMQEEYDKLRHIIASQGVNNTEGLSTTREAEYKSVIEQYNLKAQTAVMSQTTEHSSSAQQLAEAQEQVRALSMAVAEKDTALLELSEELSTKSKELIEVKKDKEAMKQKSSEEIRGLMGSVQEMQRKVHEKSPEKGGSEAERTEQKLSNLRAELDETYGQQINMMKDQLRQQHEEELVELKKKYETVQGQLNGNSSTDNQLRELQKEIDELKSQLDDKDATLARNKVDMALLNEKFVEAVNSYQKQIEELKSAPDHSSDEGKENKSKKTIKQLQKQLIEANDEIVQLKGALGEESAALQEKLNTTETDSTSVEMAKLKTEYLEEIEKLKQENDEAVGQLLNQLENASEKNQSMKFKHEQEVENLKRKYEDERQSCKASQDSVDVDEIRQKIQEEQEERYEKKLEDMQEHLSSIHEIDMKRLKSSLAVDYEDDLKIWKQQMQEDLDQKVEAIKAEKDKEFIEELQNVRKELADRHEKEIEMYRIQLEEKPVKTSERVVEGEMIKEELVQALIEPELLQQRAPPLEMQLHQMSIDSMPPSTPGVDSELLHKLQGENQDLSEARDALLQQIDESHHQQEQMQEEILTLMNDRDRVEEEMVLLRQKPVSDELEALKTQNEMQKKELTDLTERYKQQEARNTALNEEVSNLTQQKKNLKDKIQHLEVQLEDASGEETSEILEEKLLSQANFFEQERQEYEKEIEEVSNQLETITVAKEEVEQAMTALKEKHATEIAELKAKQKDGSLAEQLDKALEERTQLASRMMELEQEFDMLKTSLEIKENEAATISDQLEFVKREKAKTVKELESKQEFEEELMLENERLMAMLSPQPSATESVDDGASSVSDHKTTDLLNEIARLKKDLRESQEIYTKENELLKQALDYEKATTAQLLQKAELAPESLNSLGPSEREVIELKQQLAKKDQREHEILTEKNKQISVLQDSNALLERERVALQKELKDQVKQVQELQERMQTSDTVSEEVQEVFGRQLTVIQAQRDELLKQLEEDQGMQSKISEIVGEKALLEESLNQEKVVLKKKLSEMEDLQRELIEQKRTFDKQISEQRRMEEMLLQRDQMEQELAKQKNILEVELQDIEEKLHEKEDQLRHEKAVLEKELKAKDNKLVVVEEAFQKREEEIQKVQMNEINEVKSNIEKDYMTKLQKLRAESDRAHAEAIARLKHDMKQQYGVQEAQAKERHMADISLLKTKHQSQVHWYTY